MDVNKIEQYKSGGAVLIFNKKKRNMSKRRRKRKRRSVSDGISFAIQMELDSALTVPNSAEEIQVQFCHKMSHKL